VVDHGQQQSVVSTGPWQGWTLAQLVGQHGPALFGRHAPRDRFPLLFKFLDAHRNLSVQVHPDDTAAANLEPPDLGKTEAWVILHADPGSRVYAGLKRGFDRQALQREVVRGTTELCLHWFEPRVGDCVFIPAGTVHALGSGLVVAEIQQSSDTTFRLFDWNRTDADGRPRTLHVEEALDTIDYQRGPIEPQPPQPTANPLVERLVECDKFVLDRWDLPVGDVPQHAGESTTGDCASGGQYMCGGDNRFHLLSVLRGTVGLDSAGQTWRLQPGQTILLPACLPPTRLQPAAAAVVLDMFLP
jgi:mannose-6-phosphate isomerase